MVLYEIVSRGRWVLLHNIKGSTMNMFTKFFDSAAGVLAGHNEDHEHVRARAEQLLMQMNSGDVEARKYIESRLND